MKTYLIWPCIDANGDPKNINSHYGFIEYVSHRPWSNLDYFALAKKAILTADKHNNVQAILGTLIKEAVQQQIIAAVNTPESDWIAHNQITIAQYSIDNGILTALMLLTGMTDLHCENIILHQCRPVIIDPEVVFNFIRLKAEDTVAFDPFIGAFSHSSVSPKEIYCFFDIDGPDLLKFTTLEKNRLYGLLQVKNDVVEACRINENAFLDGFKIGLAWIKQYQTQILQWLALQQWQYAVFRILPKATLDLAAECKNISTYEAFDKYCEYMMLLNSQIDHAPQIENLLEHIDLPENAIYAKETRQYLWNEYRYDSIPWFYALLDKKCLYAGIGIPVVIHTADAKHENYFPTTLKERFLHRLKFLIDYESYKIILQDVDREVQRVISVPTDADDFQKVDLEAASHKKSSPRLFHLPAEDNELTELLANDDDSAQKSCLSCHMQ